TIAVDLLDRVNTIIKDVIATVVMPSFRSLRPEDIELKDTPGHPDDLVTIVDKAAERCLLKALGDVVPGAVFIGEEGVADNPSLLASLSAAAPAWLIDPIDGTKNFAQGQPDFGVMLALVQHARVVDGSAGGATIRLHSRCRARWRHANRWRGKRAGPA